MPPRALTEPATARWLSILRNRLPEMGLPVAWMRAFCISGMGLRGDSIMPLVHSVSGKHFRMNGAKRSRRASASAMSASDTTSWQTASVSSKGRYLGLIQRVSFCSAISFKVGSCSISFAAYSLIAIEKLLLSHRYGAVPGRGTAWGRTLCQMLSDAYSEFNYTEYLLNYNAHCKQTMNVNIVQNARHRF